MNDGRVVVRNVVVKRPGARSRGLRQKWRGHCGRD